MVLAIAYCLVVGVVYITDILAQRPAVFDVVHIVLADVTSNIKDSRSVVALHMLVVGT